MKISSAVKTVAMLTLAASTFSPAKTASAGIVTVMEFVCRPAHTSIGDKGPQTPQQVCAFEPVERWEQANDVSPYGNDGAVISDSGAVERSATEQVDPCSKVSPNTSRPVVISNGTKLIPEGDFSVGTVMPLGIGRSYVSSSNQIGAFGYKWSSTIDYGLKRTYPFAVC
ncbi:MAG: DUF6531 domain-containing protein, partial [Arenimonas sp.]